jgi:hypothetical protein
MSPRVISLLERLPYVNGVQGWQDVEWYPDTCIVDYRDPRAARSARDAGRISFWATGEHNEPDLGFMRPGDVALGTPHGRSQHVILDTEASEYILIPVTYG